MFFKGEIKKIAFVILGTICVLFSSCGKKQYHVGDIVMSDGSVLSKDSYLSYEGKANPVAVIFTVDGVHEEDTKRVLGVGIYESDTVLSFAKDSTSGDNTNFLRNRAYVINQKFDFSTGVYKNEGFSGEFDGRNFWKNITRRDKTASANMNTVYPAYAFVETYGAEKKCGKFSSKGWYLPTIIELYKMFESEPLLNEVLEACGGDTLDHRIWSSSQDYFMKDVQLLLDMETGEVRRSYKDAQAHVRSIYCFADK